MISVFWGIGLKSLGRVGIHVFFSVFFFYNFMHFERHFPFKMHTIIFFSRKPEKILVSPVN